jgi:hypothetical protein
MTDQHEKMKSWFDENKDFLPNDSLPFGHEERFLNKLNAKSEPKKTNRWMIYSIAASLVFVLGMLFTFSVFTKSDEISTPLFASKQQQEAHDYFQQLLVQEVNKLQEFDSPESKEIVTDALEQLKVFDLDYQEILNDCKKQGLNKQNWYALIQHFQMRLEFLETVIQKIERIEQEQIVWSSQKTI